MSELEEVFRVSTEAAKEAVRAIKGGPSRTGEKLLKASTFFLFVPDPTMISTTIGVSMVVAGKLLSRRREKGLLDDVVEFNTSLAEAMEALREIKYWKLTI